MWVQSCYDCFMSRPDLNLLVTLDVLLAEGSVARAAKRLRLSPSAMSRALARLREATGDPLLVRAGRADGASVTRRPGHT
jgi:DNA-binding transcriptional LysR family regulator